MILYVTLGILGYLFIGIFIGVLFEYFYEKNDITRRELIKLAFKGPFVVIHVLKFFVVDWLKKIDWDKKVIRKKINKKKDLDKEYRKVMKTEVKKK